MARIYIDSQPYEVDPSKDLLRVCLSLGFDLPYFCWHPALGSVGACRQCAVKQFKDANDTRGRIVMSCLVPAADGTRISIDDPEAVAFRRSVIEWLMTNHPHDCPVCDEGGECHLQDVTLMTGHTYRRDRFKKRTFENQYLGPLINHEMNRCIQCYRCVRFYRNYAGGRDLDAFGIHNHVYFGRHKDGILENEFSGNLVEVCPTGVFTDKTLKKQYTRKWDLQTAPSICTHCGVGCNIIPGERSGILRRILNRYNGEVNGYFLCDRGRFGYGFVNSDRRIRRPVLRTKASPTAESPSRVDLLKRIAILIAKKERVIGIGSPRTSLESNFALQTLVGQERFFTGLSDSEFRLATQIINILRNGPARSPSIRDIEQSDVVLVLGEDVTNTAPRIALALRQSVLQQPLKLADALKVARWQDAAVRDIIQDRKGPFFIAASSATKLDDIATKTYHASPDDVARFGFAIAHRLNKDAPPVDDLADDVGHLAGVVAEALRNAERPLVVSGMSLGSDAVVQAAANVAWALCAEGKPGELSYVLPEANTVGMGLLGGGSLSEAFKAVDSGKIDVVIILENDLYRRAPSHSVDRVLGNARHVIVLDHLKNQTTSKAELVLPAGTFAEADGTFVSSEGRAQRFYQVFLPTETVQESWRWLRDAMHAAGRPEVKKWQSLDDVIGALAKSVPVFERVSDAAPSSDFRVVGQKIPRESKRYSGRTAMTANENVSEPKPPDDLDSPFTFTMEGYQGMPPAPLINLYWAPSWNSVQSLNKFQEEVGGPLHGGDPGVRLIEAAQKSTLAFFKEIPKPFRRNESGYLVIPVYHIFGSEELSVHAPWIAELAPKPYLALHPSDAEKLNVKEGSEVSLQLNGSVHRLSATLWPDLPPGLAGLPVGLPGLSGIDLPQWGRL